eukprot:1194493-Prorocentrum_minimum.AAC.2
MLRRGGRLPPALRSRAKDGQTPGGVHRAEDQAALRQVRLGHCRRVQASVGELVSIILGS